MPLDIPTLFIVSICVTGLLGIFLLVLWIQDRSTRALGWWAAAYLIGGFAVALWLVQPLFSASWPNEIASSLLFISCGMIWNGARMFHGRPVLPLALVTGAIVWLMTFRLPIVAEWGSARVVLSSIIITIYIVLTAIELKRERRKPQSAHRHAILMPILHGAVFLSPILTTHFFSDAAQDFGEGWFALFALLTLLYVVGTAFIVVVMAQERSMLVHKTAALTDPLTGFCNRRGFFERADKIIELHARRREPVSVLMFDLDHFKSINDRYGHAVGDEVLRVFAATASGNMRADDTVGRLGGEEFAAILSGTVEAAATVAHRVRMAFEVAGTRIAGIPVGATVSVGVASMSASGSDIHELLIRADAALYRAKTSGRNRVAADGGPPATSAPPLVPEPGAGAKYAALL